MTITPVAGNAAWNATCPFTVLKKTIPPSGSNFSETTYNAEWFRFYNDGYFQDISVVNGVTRNAIGRWVTGTPTYGIILPQYSLAFLCFHTQPLAQGTFYQVRLVFVNSTAVRVYCNGSPVQTLTGVTHAAYRGSWQFCIDTSKRNAANTFEAPSTWKLGYVSSVCAGSPITLPPTTTPLPTTTTPQPTTTTPLPVR